MLSITVNGETVAKDALSVSELLADMGYKTRFIAVELNGEILKKDRYDSTLLKDGDKLEVVNFVGGG